MAKRRNIGGQYYSVREKNTSAGKKGTIIGKWSPSKSTKDVVSIVKKATKTTHSRYKNTFKWLSESD